MAHLLEQTISQVRGRARRLMALYALGYSLGAVVLAALILGTADYLIRFQDPGIRLMCSLALVLVAAWALYRFWLRGFGRRLSDVEIARRIERRFPPLADRLASTVEFLKQPEDDPCAGSPALRRAAIIETTTALERINVDEVLETGPTRRALTALATVLAVVAGIVLFSPSSVQIGLLRLARPFGSDAWPRFYSVKFREAPRRLAAGRAFEVELIKDAEHHVPDDARIQYRYEGASSAHETEKMNLVNGAMVARKDNVTRPFWYRAEGGDDLSMPWIRLEVVEPPRVESLDIVLHPPDYTGLPVESGEKSIRAVRGTRVAISGTSTKKLRSAKLHQENTDPLALVLSADGYGFSLTVEAESPFVVDRSGPYWISLEDGEGLVGGADEHWDIRAIADQVPTVTIEQPVGNIFVTPSGEVPLKISVKDDLAIHDVALHFSRAEGDDTAVTLYEGPATVPPQSTRGLLAGGQLGENQTLEHRWTLSQLELQPGTQVTFWAAASDYLPQTGKSTVRRLSIITPAELEERLAQRQTLIFGELQRVLKLEQDARGQTRSLEIQLREVGQLNKSDIDNAQAAELNQRQVKRTLTSESEGIPAQVADFLADLHSNNLDSPELERHMEGILSELERLGREHLPTIERELTSVIKAAQARLPKGNESPPTAGDDAPLKQSLAATGENQDQVIGSLENMLGELSQWDSYRRFGRDIAQMQRDQEEIARNTRELGQKTLGRDQKDLDAQQKADLKKLSNQQMDLSRRLEKVQQQMTQTSQSLQDSDPLSSATIADGLKHAEQQAISGQMRQSSEQLEKNQLNQAATRQQRIGKDLDELMAILSNRREQELNRLVEQLRESERQLSALRKEQAGLRKQMKAAVEIADPAERARQLERLSRQQKKLEEETARLSRRLERLQADRAGQSTSGAAGKMGQAGQSGEQGDGAGAEQQARAAEQDLEEAQQQLAERRRQAEADLAQEQLSRLEDSLKSLHERQAKMIKETERLEGLRAEAGRFSRAQLSSLNDLARQQRALQGETSLLYDKLSLAEVIHLALEGAVKHMTQAGDLLERRDTGNSTQLTQEAARARIAQLISAFSQNTPKQQKEGKEGGGGGGEGNSPRGDGAQVLAQLKLLKMLQQELNERYRSVSENPDDDRVANRRTLAELAEEQGRLAELTLKLAKPPEPNPEDNPDKLPDVRKQGLDAGEISPPHGNLDDDPEKLPELRGEDLDPSQKLPGDKPATREEPSR